MSIQDDIAKFLRTNAFINKLNFAMGTFKVYPSGYQKEVADAIASGEIKTRTAGASSAAAGASYDMNYDSLELSPTFHIGHLPDQAFLVHECTHAHLDIQNFGSHSGHENEAVAYVAEAVFLEAAGAAPLGSQTIRVISHRIAKTVLAGTYWIPATELAALKLEVAAHPNYATKAVYNSNAFNRSLIQRALR